MLVGFQLFQYNTLFKQTNIVRRTLRLRIDVHDLVVVAPEKNRRHQKPDYTSAHRHHYGPKQVARATLGIRETSCICKCNESIKLPNSETAQNH